MNDVRPLPVNSIVMQLSLSGIEIMSKEEIAFVGDYWQLEQYHKAGNSHVAWALSDELLAASRLLKNHRYQFDFESLHVGDNVPDEGKILSSELMLRGFAIECLLKALWVNRGEAICATENTSV